MWHGRNSYRRSAKLAQFVTHRGLIISIIQAVFFAIFYFAPIALYQGWLMVGYATAYTMAPVFSLVLDRDVNEDLALLYPELYKDLTKVKGRGAQPNWLPDVRSQGRVLSYKTFFTWLEISLYQGQFLSIHSSNVGQEAHPLRIVVRCRVSNYDHVLDLVRERVPEHRFHFVH